MIARRLYRLLLYLHPPLFRERFAPEMLWLFDQTAEDVGTPRLITDAVLSLLKQHMSVDTAPRCTGRLFQQVPADSLHAVRFFQAGAAASLILIGFFSLLQQSVPLPRQPRSITIRRYRPDTCAELGVATRMSERRHGMQFALAGTRSHR